MTVATVIYYSGYHPYTLKPTRTPISKKEKEEQHRFFFWYKKENRDWIKKTLNKVGRVDLLDILLPDDRSWKSNKLKPVKHTFDDAISVKASRIKNKHRGKKQRR
jgi:hypothetical protein